MIRVMFVCHGNICRSTMSEFVLRDMVEKQGIGGLFTIASSATSREEIGNGVHYGTKRILENLGIDCSEKRAVQLTYEDKEYYDYFIAMDEENVRNMKRILGGDVKIHKLLEFAGRNEDIADPWYTGDFNETYYDVSEGCHGFLDWLRERNEI